MRPAGENGPLILCLDTSGSMGRKGAVVESLVFRADPKRPCIEDVGFHLVGKAEGGPLKRPSYGFDGSEIRGDQPPDM